MESYRDSGVISGKGRSVNGNGGVSGELVEAVKAHHKKNGGSGGDGDIIGCAKMVAVAVDLLE